MSGINPRKKYFIDKKFQGKFVATFILILGFCLSVLAGVIIYSSKDANTVRLANGRVWAQTAFDFILPILLVTFIVVFITALIIVTYVTIRASHKISGPLYRLLQDIGAVGGGDLTRSFNIRSNDQLQELAKSLGAMAASLRQQHKHSIETFNSLRRFLILKEFSLSRKDADQCIVMLKEMQSALDKFKV